MVFKGAHSRRADTLAEYALILGVVSLAIFGMNTYIKRGLQGRVKDMADKMISMEQVDEMDPTTESNSITLIATPDSSMTKETLQGGSVQASIHDMTNIQVERHSKTQADPATAPKGATQGGAIDRPDYEEAKAVAEAAVQLQQGKYENAD